MEAGRRSVKGCQSKMVRLTALERAASEGSVGAVRRLVRRGADVNGRREEDGSTALHAAAQEGKLEAVKALVELGADVHAQAHDMDKRRCTSLP